MKRYSLFPEMDEVCCNNRRTAKLLFIPAKSIAWRMVYVKVYKKFVVSRVLDSSPRFTKCKMSAQFKSVRDLVSMLK